MNLSAEAIKLLELVQAKIGKRATILEIAMKLEAMVRDGLKDEHVDELREYLLNRAG